MAKQTSKPARLTFTRGPQRGQVIELTKMMNVLGRDRTCDIVIQDEYASRQHARVIVEGSRVRLVNTSPNGTKINGKAVEQAVLNDGDLLGFGLETELRYEVGVAESAHPGGTPPPPLPDATKRISRTSELPKGKAEPAESAAQPPDSQRKFKKPTMIVWVVGYIVVFAVLVVFLNWFFKSEKNGPGIGGPLTDEEIRKSLAEPMELKALSPREAAEALAKANNGYDAWVNKTAGPDQLYWTLQDYKTSLAYKHADHFSGEETKYQGRMDEIINALAEKPHYEVQPNGSKVWVVGEVIAAYKNAYRAQRMGDWVTAEAGYHYVLTLVPDTQHPIYLNVRKQLNIVQEALRAMRARQGPKEW